MTFEEGNERAITREEFRGLSDAVTEASDLLLHLWPGSGGDQSSLNVTSKDDGSLVSRADYGSNEILCRSLRDLFPRDRILSEEGVGEGSQLKRDDEPGATREWIIDPLDGTKSFLAGRDDFSILVSLCMERVPVFGLMRFPARKLDVVAWVGEGSTVNGVSVSVAGSRMCRPHRVYFRNFETLRPDLSSESMDSGLALMKVAAGEFDGAVIRMTHHKEWDIAAPIAAIVAAGGTVSNEEGEPIFLGGGTPIPRYVVVSGGPCHGELLTCIPR